MPVPPNPNLHRAIASDLSAAERLAEAKGLQLAFHQELAYARFCAEQLQRRVDPVGLARTQTFVSGLRQRIAQTPVRRPS